MAKLILNNITSGYATHTLQNANNDLIEAALENTLSRDGTTPNTMGVNLDMNNHKITNLAAPGNPNDSARLQDVQNAVVNGVPNSSIIPFIQAGTGAVERTVQDKNREIVSVKDFGAVGDGVTDDTLAIQTAINTMATSGRHKLYVPDGVYNFTRLYFQYDAVNNPDYPAIGTQRNGQLIIEGSGAPRTSLNVSTLIADVTPATVRGTVLKCTLASASTLAALNLERSAFDNYENAGVSFRDMSIVAETSGYIMAFQNGHALTSLRDIVVKQYGVGSGIRIKSCWLFSVENSFIYSRNAANIGTGVYYFSDGSIDADSLNAGLVSFTGTTSRDFNLNWVIGSSTDIPAFGGTARELQAVSMRSCQGGGGITANALFQGGIFGINVDACYFETSPISIQLGVGAAGIRISNSYFVNSPSTAAGTDKHILFASSCRNVTIENNLFAMCSGEGIRLTVTEGVQINNNRFTTYVYGAYNFTGQGYGINASATTIASKVAVRGNTFNGLLTNVVAPAKLEENANYGDAEDSIYASRHYYGGFARYQTAAKAAAYAIVQSDPFYIPVNATAGAIAITLPQSSAVGVSLMGKELMIKKIDASANAVTVTAAAGDTIEGAATFVLAAQWNSITLISSGTTWVILAVR